MLSLIACGIINDDARLQGIGQALLLQPRINGCQPMRDATS